MGIDDGRCRCEFPKPVIERVRFNAARSGKYKSKKTHHSIKLSCRECGGIIAWYKGNVPLKVVMQNPRLKRRRANGQIDTPEQPRHDD